MTLRKLTIVFLTLILAFGTLSYGQQPARTLEGLTGKVIDGTNKPLPGMTVIAQGPNLRRETITDIEGNYYLALTPGKYEIRAGTNCDQTSYHKDVEVENGKTTTLDLVIPLYESYAANVSIYQLLSSPERFQDRLVIVSGYYRFGQELSALFASKDDADYLIGKNSVWISLSGNEDLKLELKTKTGSRNLTVSDFDGKYITIEGVFDKAACGHMGMSSGQIKRVIRVIELTRYFDGKKKL